MRTDIIFITLFICLGFAVSTPAQEANYDESKVPAYTLPDPLVANDGTAVTTAEQWTDKRRAEVLELFETHVYGKAPAKPDGLHFKTIEVDRNALDGEATRKQITVYFSDDESGPQMDILIYLPNGRSRPVPGFLTLNFNGNCSIHPDPEIIMTDSWMRDSEPYHVVNNHATEKTRGSKAFRWPVEHILDRGYALATIYYGDIDPDYDDGFKNGVHALYNKDGQTPPAPDEWGSIAAWAWGLSRGMDYLETDSDIDHERIAVMGHSRLGKTALWAGATDTRFAIVISNDSGCGGAALSRRAVGETVKRINTAFPHWFCDNFNTYNDNEAACPVDQHMLIALAAPRPVYVASAAEDRWADPKGEFLSAKNAGAVYKLFGEVGVGVSEMPEINQPVGDFIGYHIRTGKHNVTLYDWDRYMDFADKHFYGRQRIF